MSNNKQSSVEWLFEQIARRQGSILHTIPFYYENQDLLQQAKAMHKEEQASTWLDSRLEDRGDNYIGKQKSFEQYYNETFNL